ANDAAAAIACGTCLVELEAIGHARIEENFDGGKGNDQPLRDAVECQLHLEANIADDELPEAMLEHDRHFFGVFALEAFRDHDARMAGVEGNIEVMVAGKPGLLNSSQDCTHDATHG